MISRRYQLIFIINILLILITFSSYLYDIETGDIRKMPWQSSMDVYPWFNFSLKVIPIIIVVSVVGHLL